MKIKIGNKIKNFTTFREIHNKWMKDPEFRKAREEHAIEFALIRAILDARTKKGMTQKELAEKIGTKQSSIARFESGKYSSTLQFIQKLVRGLNLEIKVVNK